MAPRLLERLDELIASLHRRQLRCLSRARQRLLLELLEPVREKGGRREENVDPFVGHISVVTNVGLTASNFATSPRYREQRQTT